MLDNYISVEEKESKENKRKKWNTVDVVEENRSKRKQLVLYLKTSINYIFVR